MTSLGLPSYANPIMEGYLPSSESYNFSIEVSGLCDARRSSGCGYQRSTPTIKLLDTYKRDYRVLMDHD